MTPEVREAFIAELRKGISIAYAARLAGLNPELMKKWIQRGRGMIPDRAPLPEYRLLAEQVDEARSHLVGVLADHVLTGAKNDPAFALRLLDRLAPDWMEGTRVVVPDEDEDDRAYLRPGGGGAVALPEEPVTDEPVTVHERERVISIPASRVHEFARMLRGKDPNGDGSDRLSRFRETADDLPPT